MKKGITVIFCILVVMVAMAQPGGGGLPGDPPPNPIPISGLAILLGLGSVIGIRKLLKRDKSN